MNNEAPEIMDPAENLETPTTVVQTDAVARTGALNASATATDATSSTVSDSGNTTVIARQLRGGPLLKSVLFTLAGLMAVVLLLLLSGVGLSKLNKPDVKGIALVASLGEQDVPITQQLSQQQNTVQVRDGVSTVVISGDLVVRGGLLRVSSSKGSLTIDSTGVTGNQKITAPANATGEICLSTGNCKQPELEAAIAAASAAANAAAKAGVQSLNGSTGAIDLQGTTNQILVSASSGAITFRLPQNINIASSPQFASINLSTAGTQRGFEICDMSGNCSATAGNTFVQGGNSFGAAASLGTNDAQDLNLETNGANRLTVTAAGDVNVVNSLNIASNLDVAGHTALGNNASVNYLNGSIGISVPYYGFLGLLSNTAVSAVNVIEENFTHIDNGVGDLPAIGQVISVTADPATSSSNNFLFGQSVSVANNAANNNDIGILHGSTVTTYAQGGGQINFVTGVSSSAVANQGTGGSVSLLTGAQNTVMVQGAGTVNYVIGTSSYVQTDGSFTGTIPTASALHTLVSANGGAITEASGLRVTSNYGSGILDNYGIYVESQTTGTNSYGIRVNSASTQALWLAGDNGFANEGIGFGATRDTNLYRSAAGTLKTDSNLAVAGTIELNTPGNADNSTYLCLNGSSQIGYCLSGGSGMGDVNQGGNSYGSMMTLGTLDNYGLNFKTNTATTFSLSNTGAAVFKNASNSTTGFQIQNAAGTGLFTVDTTNTMSTFNSSLIVGTNSTTAFRVQNASNVSLLSIDATNNQVMIGVPSATPTLFTVAMKTSVGDPAGASDGSIYYNASTQKLRCYEGGAWVNCTGSGTGGTGDVNQGGNSYGTTMKLGTTDAQSVQIIANGTGQALFDRFGQLHLGNPDSIGLAASPIQGSIVGTSNSTNGGSGGSLALQAGSAGFVGSGTGGTLALYGGNPGQTGTGGDVYITSGTGGSTSGMSGTLSLTTGSTFSGNSGNTVIDTGTANGGGTAGIVQIGVTNAPIISLGNYNTLTQINGPIQALSSTLFKNNTNSTTAFRVQDTGGTNLLLADTSNQTVNVGVTSDTMYMSVQNVGGSYASTPDSAAADISGDIDLRAKINPTTWTPATDAGIINKQQAAGSRSYAFMLSPASKLKLNVYFDGTNAVASVSTVAVSGGGTQWVRATRASATGDTNFYTSADGVTWTALGTTVSSTSGTLFNSTSDVRVGTGGGSTLYGNVYRAQIYNGINGTLAVDFNPNNAASTASTSWVSLITGETWTLNGSTALGGSSKPAATFTNSLTTLSNSVLVRNTGSDSLAAFQVQNAAGTNLFTVDTANNKINVGGAASSAPALFVLGNGNSAGDPVGTNGASYYNSSTNKFRCYENGAWANCLSAGTGSGDVSQGGNMFNAVMNIGTLDNYGINFKTNTNTTFSLSNTGAATFKNFSDSANAFQIQNAAGASLVNVDSSTNQITLLGNNSGEVRPWSTATNVLPATRSNNPHAVIAGGYIYYIGGANSGNSPTSTVYSAKLNADGSPGTWSTASNSLPAGRSNHTTVVANGYVYVIGGSDGSNGTATVYYARLNADGSVGTWSTAANSLPDNRRGATSVVANGYVYVIGGTDNTSNKKSTVYYARLNADGSVGTWGTASNSLPTNSVNGLSTVANGYVYYIGNGSATSSPTATVYYARLNADGSVGTWSTAANSLPAVRWGFVSMISNGYVYVIAGSNDTSGTPTNTVYYARLNADGSVGTWSTGANNLPVSRYRSAGVAANGYMYLLGGSDGTNNQNIIYYTRTSTVTVGGNLDLVSLQGQDMADPGSTGTGSTGGALTAGNGTFVGDLQVQGMASFANSMNVAGALNIQGGALVGTGSASGKGLVVQGASSQTADLLQLQDSSANTLTYFNSSGYLNFYRAAASTDFVLTARVAADANNRLVVRADGQLNWGDGTAATDTNLYRSAAGTLKTDSALTVAGPGLFKNSANSTAALQVQDVAGTNLLKVDTTNQAVSLAAAYSSLSLNLPGTVGDYARTPDSVQASITGDIDLYARVALTDWTPAALQTIMAQKSGPNNTQAWQLAVQSTGKLTFFVHNGSPTSVDSSVAPTISDGQTLWVRVTRNSTTGTVTFYTAVDQTNIPSSWTQLGTTVASGAGLIQDVTTNITVGSTNGGSAPMQGSVYRARALNGIAGTVVVDFNTADAPSVSSITWNSSTTGETWTLGGAAALSGTAQALANFTSGGSSLASSLSIASRISSASLFQVQDASAGVNLLTVNSTNNRVVVGSAAATPTLFVFGEGTSGSDPTGTAGAMYYNSSLNKFRCYENGAWVNCIGSGSGGSGTGDINQNGNSFNADVTIGTNDLFGLNLETHNITRVSIDGTTGNVGIGNTTPGNKFSVNTPVTPSATAQALVATGANTNIGLIVQGAASQSADLQQWQTSAGGLLARVTNNGGFSAQYLATGSNQPTSGGVRLGNATAITWRNAGNTADVQGVVLDANNALVLGGGTAPVLIGSTSTPGTAEKLRINTPTTVDNTAATILSAGSTTDKGLVVQGMAGQSANLFEIQDSTGSTVVSGNAAGTFRVAQLASLTAGKAVLVTNGDTNSIQINANTATNKALVIKAAASQTANLQEWQSNSGTVLASVSATGNLSLGVTVASQGVIRLENSTSLYARNTANTGDIQLIGSNGSDQVTIANGGQQTNVGGNLAVTGSLTTGTPITVTNGGTGAGTFAQYGLLFGNNTSAVQATSAGSTGQCLTATTGGAPSWGSCGAGDVNQGGNGFGATMSLGTTDNQGLNLLAHGNAVLQFSNTGQTTFQNASDSAAAFRVQNSSGTSLFTIDSTNARVYVGNPTADSTGAVLVLDTKNTSGDPTGIDGGMYYNSNLGKFRCYENGSWKDCIYAVLGATKTADQAFSSTSYAGVNNLSFSVLANKAYSLRCSLVLSVPAGTNGGNISTLGPGTATQYTATFDKAIESSGDNYATSSTYDDSSASTVFRINTTSTGSNRFIVNYNAVLINGASAGTWQLRAKAADASSSITFYSNSSCDLKPL